MSTVAIRYWANADVPTSRTRVGINLFKSVLIKSKKQKRCALPILKQAALRTRLRQEKPPNVHVFGPSRHDRYFADESVETPSSILRAVSEDLLRRICRRKIRARSRQTCNVHGTAGG